jgi:uncharacterized protein (DUF58 family)
MTEHAERDGTRAHAATLLRQARRLRFRVDPRALADLAGAYHSARPGVGLVFSELRPYEPGDDVRHIDWNVTARMSRPYVRHYVEERALTLRLVVDASTRMTFGLPGRTKLDRASQAAALLASAAIQNGDRVGLEIVGDRGGRSLQPRTGVRHLARILRALIAGGDAARTQGGSEALGRLAARERRSLVVVLGDFAGVEPGRSWRRLARRHRVTAIRVVDPMEEELPVLGLLETRSLDDGGPALIDTGSEDVRRGYREEAARVRRAFERTCDDAGMVRMTLSTRQEPIAALLEHFRKAPPAPRGRIRRP